MDRIQSSGVFSAEDLEKIKADSDNLGDEATGEHFVAALRDHGWLTEYQAKVVVIGSDEPLLLGDYIILAELGRSDFRGGVEGAPPAAGSRRGDSFDRR